MEADPARRHPAHPAEEERPGLSPGVDRGRLAARRDHRAAGEGAAGAAGRRRHRRLGDALRQSGDRGRRSSGCSKPGATRILVAPLYPQYCAATTASAIDATFAAIAAMRWQPALRTLPPYHDDPLYIGALKADLERQIGGARFRARAAAAELPRHAAADARRWAIPIIAIAARPRACWAKRWTIPIDVAFQSRFGRAKWLEPATDMVLAAYPAQGVTSDRHRRAGLFGRLPRDDRGTWAFAAASDFSPPAERISRGSTASTTATRGWRCSTRWSAANLPDGGRGLTLAKTKSGREYMARVAIVTGGTRGIGEAISIALEGHGHEGRRDLCRQ